MSDDAALFDARCEIAELRELLRAWQQHVDPHPGLDELRLETARKTMSREQRHEIAVAIGDYAAERIDADALAERCAPLNPELLLDDEQRARYMGEIAAWWDSLSEALMPVTVGEALGVPEILSSAGAVGPVGAPGRSGPVPGTPWRRPTVEVEALEPTGEASRVTASVTEPGFGTVSASMIVTNRALLDSTREELIWAAANRLSQDMAMQISLATGACVLMAEASAWCGEIASALEAR